MRCLRIFPVVEPHPKHRVGQKLRHGTLKLQKIFFCHAKASYPIWFEPGRARSGRRDYTRKRKQHKPRRTSEYKGNFCDICALRRGGRRAVAATRGEFAPTNSASPFDYMEANGATDGTNSP